MIGSYLQGLTNPLQGSSFNRRQEADEGGDFRDRPSPLSTGLLEEKEEEEEQGEV